MKLKCPECGGKIKKVDTGVGTAGICKTCEKPFSVGALQVIKAENIIKPGKEEIIAKLCKEQFENGESIAKLLRCSLFSGVDDYSAFAVECKKIEKVLAELED